MAASTTPQILRTFRPRALGVRPSCTPGVAVSRYVPIVSAPPLVQNQYVSSVPPPL